MNKGKFYTLPELPYEYDALSPYISANQLMIHHEKHHAAYVAGANIIFEKLERARKENTELDMKSTLKELSFHIGGHLLHSMFWNNLSPANDGGGEPQGELGNAIASEFGSFERFKSEFAKAAASVEGSGWAAMTYCKCAKRPLIAQIEKHNVNVYPNFRILLVLDLWEHAYYLDYRNERARFIESFWKIVNWKKVEERFAQLMR